MANYDERWDSVGEYVFCEKKFLAGVPVVVTRHPALIEFINELGLIPPDSVLTKMSKEQPSVNCSIEVIAHAKPEDVEGRWVIGVLPLHLAEHAECVTEVGLSIPADMRGKELSIEQMREYHTGVKTYKVAGVDPPRHKRCVYCGEKAVVFDGWPYCPNEYGPNDGGGLDITDANHKDTPEAE